MGIDAEVELLPVMNADDLRKGLKAAMSGGFDGAARGVLPTASLNKSVAQGTLSLNDAVAHGIAK